MHVTTEQTVRRVEALFAELGPTHPTKLGGVYDDQVVFIDPLHRIDGRAALETYMDRMSRGLRWARFEFGTITISGEHATIEWVMRFAMKALPGEHALEGVTLLDVRDGLVVRHRDYFDVGAMLYEKVPALGWVIRRIKGAV